MKLEWQKLWNAMDANPELWIDTTENMFDEMLEVLPPRALGNDAFLVGEPTSHNDYGEAVYACFARNHGAFQARYMTRREFAARQAVRS